MQCYRFSLLIGLVEQNVTQDVNILCISVSSACSHPWMWPFKETPRCSHNELLQEHSLAPRIATAAALATTTATPDDAASPSLDDAVVAVEGPEGAQEPSVAAPADPVEESVAPMASVAADAEPSSGTRGSGSNNMEAGAIAGIVAAGLTVLVAITAAIVFVARRRRSNSHDHAFKGAVRFFFLPCASRIHVLNTCMRYEGDHSVCTESTQHSVCITWGENSILHCFVQKNVSKHAEDPSTSGSAATLAAIRTAGVYSLKDSQPAPHVASVHMRDSVGLHAPSESETFDFYKTVNMTRTPPPAAGSPVEDHMDFLHQQLDSIGMERPMLNGLLLLGSSGNQRLQGGALHHACSSHMSIFKRASWYFEIVCKVKGSMVTCCTVQRVQNQLRLPTFPLEGAHWQGTTMKHIFVLCRAGSRADGQVSARRTGVRHQVLCVARCLRGRECPLLPAHRSKCHRAGSVPPPGPYRNFASSKDKIFTLLSVSLGRLYCSKTMHSESLLPSATKNCHAGAQRGGKR